MALIDDKKQIFGQIAALRTLNEGFPELNLSNSLPSISNDSSTLDFIIDLLKSLIGYEQLRDSVVDIITYNLDNFEVEIKKALKKELKGIVSCGVNPSIPSFINYSGTGVDIKVNKLDFFNIMKVDPDSPNGKYVYDDTFGQLNSTDFNTFLYHTIQNEGSEQNWGQQTTNDDILAITFTENTGSDTNILNIKASSYYSNPVNDKTLTDLNNDYIDSINIFGTQKMMTNIIDGLFGTLTSVFGKSQKQLEEEEKINNVIECIINMDDDQVLSDNFFTFSNEEISVIEERAKDRKNGIRILKTCGNVASSVPVNNLESLSNALTGATNQSETKVAIQQGIDDMADVSALNSNNESNKITIKLNFIELLIRRFMLSISNFIISPKIIAIFLLNYKIIYGENDEYNDAIDFLKKNKNLIRSIVNKIRDLIIKILLERVLKEVSVLVAVSVAKRQIEKGNNNVAQLLSLVGVSQDVLRLITNLA